MLTWLQETLKHQGQDKLEWENAFAKIWLYVFPNQRELTENECQSFQLLQRATQAARA